MSKKQLHNRLDSLFSGFEERNLPVQPESLEALPTWAWEADEAGHYVKISPEVRDSLGFNPSRFIGQPVAEFAIAQDDQPEVLAAFQRSVFPVEVCIYFQSNEGTYLPVRLHILARTASNGHGAGFRGIAQVLSENIEHIPSSTDQTGGTRIRPVEKIQQDEPNRPPRNDRKRKQIPGLASVSGGDVGILASGLTTAAKQSLSKKSVVAQSKTDDRPAVIAAPIQLGDRGTGVLELIGEGTKQRWTEDERLLVQEVANQLALALENAHLYQAVEDELSERVKAEEEVRKALQALEVRERYQANVARSVAMLSESGLEAINDVMTILRTASLADRVFFARAHQSGKQLVWANSTNSSGTSREIPVDAFPRVMDLLKKNGWAAVRRKECEPAEQKWLDDRGTKSILILAVPGKSTTPGLIVFEQLDHERTWRQEEINVLRVAADAVGNTLVREDLLNQLQVSLKETENLYAASHRLSLATDFSEMIRIVVEGAQIPGMNRAVLMMFDQQENGHLKGIHAEANWYSGTGAAPDELGHTYDTKMYLQLLERQEPEFIADTNAHSFPADLKGELDRQGIRSLAIIPLWSGKDQIGALVLHGDQPYSFNPQETRTIAPLADQLATGIQNRALFHQTEISLAETQLLYNVSASIADAENTQDLINVVIANSMPAKAQRLSLQMIGYNQQGQPDWMEVVGFMDRSGAYRRMGLRNPIASFPFINSLTSAPLVVNDIQTYPFDPISRESLTRLNIVSGVVAPLFSGGRLIGLLGALSDQPAEFSEDEVRLFHITANGIAVALERQNLFGEAQRRALELQTAAEVARDTSSTLTMDDLLRRMVNLIRERFNFYHASIFLLDADGQYAVVRESTGQAGEDMKKRNHRLAVGSRSVIGRASATGEPYIVNDVTQHAFYQPNPLLPKTRSEIGLPLKISNRVIGALDIQATELNAFTESEVAVLRILADQIAVAIENARAYEMAQKAVEEMREVDRLKSQFLANMSHELRTPLNSIIGFSRVILKGIDGPINETQEQDLSSIYNSGQHLLSLINNILDLSKIEAGKMELAFTEVNLTDIINSVMSTAIGLVKDKPVKLYSNVPVDLPTVSADQTRVRQVLLNFLSNAAKFTERGSITVEASLTRSPSNQPEVMITVTDSGGGIAQEDQIKLFLPFSQVDDSPTRKTGGTGLGLSICRSFIELHGGRIGLASSEVGKGSTFFFTLPLAKEESGTEEEDLSIPNANRVLSIDDDLQVVQLYQRYLKPHGYQVVALTNPQLAVQQAKELKPLAITLDLMMPEVDGWKVIQELKNDPETREIPIIICSILEEEEKGFSLGAADYLVKPFLQEDLITAVNRLNRDGKIKDLLLVDDSIEDLRLLQKLLEQTGSFRIWAAEGGQQALKVLQTLRPDAIFLDLFMPDLDGFSLLEMFRTDPVLRTVPVIILTGADLTPEQHQLLEEFGQNMIRKGSMREVDLLNTLESALQNIRNHPTH